MTELNVNLNRAQKYITRLKKYIAEMEQPNSYVDLGSRLKQSNVESLNEFITEKQEIIHNYCESRFTIQRDLNALKQGVFKGNLNSGISDILIRIEEINFRINLLTKLGKSGDQYNKITEDGLKKLLESSYLGNSAYVCLTNSMEYTEEINGLRKELEKLENQRDRLNANTEISVKISEITARVLGL